MNITDFDGFVTYLKAMLPTRGPDRGARSRLARHLGCQTSFISQVLSGKAYFSLEQAIRVARFLNLTADEKDYLLLLLQQERAGTTELREHFASKLASKSRSMNSIKSQVGKVRSPSEDVAATYYSSWIYCACHILCSLPKLSNAGALRRYLSIPQETFDQVIGFLEQSGFIEVNGQELRITQTRLHIANDSIHTVKHHLNWRMRAMNRIEKQEGEDLHFSALYGISEADAKRIRSLLLKVIKDTEKIVTPSKVEVPFVFLLDFFRFE